MPFCVAERRRQPEWMDQPDLNSQQHEQALSGLARINKWSGAYRVFWKHLKALSRAFPDRPLRVLDLASGAGDGAIRLWQRANRAGLSIQIDGCDRSPTAIAYAQHCAESRNANVRFFQCDVLREALPVDYDVLINSLFLHHLDESDAVSFLRRAADVACRTLMISDLVRSRVGLILAYAATRVFTRSPVVHFDGPISVRGAFSVAQLQEMATRAGLESASVVRHWPCHMFLSWTKS
jgi:2-polyprenyl-3-methyl-5-hydroxy-6-metoxy-1,4-benzoquinol methylase